MLLVDIRAFTIYPFTRILCFSFQCIFYFVFHVMFFRLRFVFPCADLTGLIWFLLMRQVDGAFIAISLFV